MLIRGLRGHSGPTLPGASSVRDGATGRTSDVADRPRAVSVCPNGICAPVARNVTDAPPRRVQLGLPLLVRCLHGAAASAGGTLTRILPFLCAIAAGCGGGIRSESSLERELLSRSMARELAHPTAVFEAPTSLPSEHPVRVAANAAGDFAIADPVAEAVFLHRDGARVLQLVGVPGPLAVAARGSLLLVGSRTSGRVDVFDVGSRAWVARLGIGPGAFASPSAIALSPDGAAASSWTPVPIASASTRAPRPRTHGSGARARGPASSGSRSTSRWTTRGCSSQIRATTASRCSLTTGRTCSRSAGRWTARPRRSLSSRASSLASRGSPCVARPSSASSTRSRAMCRCSTATGCGSGRPAGRVRALAA